jgi:S-adenosylhomocysteine hydrolase
VDVEIDDEVARIKLDAVGVDSLTPEQEMFLASWQE